jgi:hypothetical protein
MYAGDGSPGVLHGESSRAGVVTSQLLQDFVDEPSSAVIN